MRNAISRISPAIIFWILLAISIAMDRALVGTVVGWGSSIFLLPAAWTLGLRYGRGREEVKTSIIVLMAASEIASPVFPGVSALSVAIISLVGIWIGIRWTSIRLWWFHALVGASTTIIVTLLARLIRSPLMITSEMWISSLTVAPITIIAYAAWMFIYARKRWFHEPF